jgi:hypothetical protein
MPRWSVGHCISVNVVRHRNLWLIFWVWRNLPDIEDPVLIQIVGATVAGHTDFHGCALGCFIAYIIEDMLTKQINVLDV